MKNIITRYDGSTIYIGREVINIGYSHDDIGYITLSEINSVLGGRRIETIIICDDHITLNIDDKYVPCVVIKNKSYISIHGYSCLVEVHESREIMIDMSGTLSIFSDYSTFRLLSSEYVIMNHKMVRSYIHILSVPNIVSLSSDDSVTTVDVFVDKSYNNDDTLLISNMKQYSIRYVNSVHKNCDIPLILSNSDNCFFTIDGKECITFDSYSSFEPSNYNYKKMTQCILDYVINFII